VVGVRRACQDLSFPRSGVYRRRSRHLSPPVGARRSSERRLAVGLVCMRRSRGNRSDALTLDTVSLLKSMIARAKSDLFLARCLYAGVPCGAVAGYTIMKLAGIGASWSAIGISPQLRAIQAYAGVAALLIMILAGVILARSRRLQVQELSKKLMAIAEDL